VGFAVLWGWLLFGEALDAATLLGALLVLAATLIAQSGWRASRP
jgi:drug/metabolite transporter (DMT)-like permease